jgi:hypothetical protein
LHNVRAYLVNVLELVERDPASRPHPTISIKSRPSSRAAPTKAPAGRACSTRHSCGSGTGLLRLAPASGRCKWA